MHEDECLLHFRGHRSEPCIESALFHSEHTRGTCEQAIEATSDEAPNSCKTCGCNCEHTTIHNYRTMLTSFKVLVGGSIAAAQAHLNSDLDDPYEPVTKSYLNECFKYIGGGIALKALSGRVFLKFAAQLMSENRHSRCVCSISSNQTRSIFFDRPRGHHPWERVCVPSLAVHATSQLFQGMCRVHDTLIRHSPRVEKNRIFLVACESYVT